ncbi:MAG: hypothetical protein K2M51_03420, partial [Helicobacter sp.]|nr:hypothetical protein [Helicobacter sp.]
SKIAIFKAALCYGFAIALRALFIGDCLRFCWGILCSLIASLAMTDNGIPASLQMLALQYTASNVKTESILTNLTNCC